LSLEEEELMLNQLTLINIVSGAFAFGPVLALIMARRRLGTLNAASWLVVWGSVIVAGEHGQFAISYSVPFISGEGAMVLLPMLAFTSSWLGYIPC
jgi:hypothetical protein